MKCKTEYEIKSLLLKRTKENIQNNWIIVPRKILELNSIKKPKWMQQNENSCVCLEVIALIKLWS